MISMSPIRNMIIHFLTSLTGTGARARRLPFGPLRTRNIYVSLQISPRTFFGVQEPWIAKLAKKHVREGDVVYDIGAHVGYTTLLFAQALRGTGAVYAFEILRYTAERFLAKTVEANEFKNIHIENVGLGISEQTLKLPIGPTAMTSIYSESGQQQFEICQVVPIDQYIRERKIPSPALIKVDIEGAEIDCLRGGVQTFTQSKPVMLIEFHSLDLLKDGYKLLKSWGYQLTTRRGINVDRQYLNRLKSFHQTVLCEYT